MEANAIPARPSKVTLALYMLYLSLGISVISVLVTWLRLGVPGPVGYWLINVLMMITIFHVQAQAPTWVWYGGLLHVAIAPIAVWLYYMIGKGKNWARITLLVLVIFETFDSMLGVIAGLALSPISGQSPLSLSAFLTSTYTLQTLLKIVAVTLLFGRVSSDWFKAVKTGNQQPITKARFGIVRVAVGLLALLIAGVVFYQVAGVGQNDLLIDAIRRNQVKKAQELLKNGADVNAKGEYGLPALVFAAGAGRVEIAKLLLDNGANIETKTGDGQTALMNASRAGQHEAVRLLLDKGADINARNSGGGTALMDACWTGKEEVVKVLLERGSDLNARDKKGLTALMRAAGRMRLPIMKLLLDQGADINAQDGGGRTALMRSFSVSPEAVNLLLDRGADVNVKDSQGRTALMEVSEKGRLSNVRLLLANGADMNQKDKNGDTALMLASKKGNSQIVELLKAHGAME